MDDETETTDDSDALDLTPRKELLLALCAAMWFVVFFGALALPLFTHDGPFRLRSRGSSTAILLTPEQGMAIFGALIGISALLTGAAIWANLRRAWMSLEPGVVAPQIPLSETVLWTGRQGRRSFSGARIVGALILVLVPLGMLWWMFSVLTSGRPLIDNPIGLLIPSFLFFLSVLPAVILFSGVMAFWFYDVFGRIVVTRRRIVWLTPLNRQIYRQIKAADVVDAFVGESDGARGSITVIKRVKGDVEHVYIDGLTQPERAQDAVRSLIR